MKGVFKKAWLALLLYALLTLICGILLCIMNDLTLISIMQLLGVFALLSGLILLAGALFSRSQDEHWWFLLQLGILQMIMAMLFFTSLDTTGLKLLLLIGICAIVVGSSELVAAVRLREELTNEVSLLVNGIASIVFGCWMVFFPGEGLLGRKLHVAIYMSFCGLTLLILAYRIWRLEKEMTSDVRALEEEISIKNLSE